MVHPRERLWVVTLVALGICLLWPRPDGGAWAAAPEEFVLQGTLVSVSGTSVALVARPGHQVTVQLGRSLRVLTRRRVSPAQIGPGDFVGVAARKEPDGSLTAVSINIFPPELKGQIRVGQWPMATGNIMTNAIVTDVVRVGKGAVTLRYPGGTAVIALPPSVSVHRLALAARRDLRSGEHVAIRGVRSADGTLSASSIVIDL
jgi:hypothetical protein